MRYNWNMPLILKATLAAVFWGIFGMVILKVSYPNTLTSANALQLLSFFIPLFLALTFSLNILLNFMPRSIAISFGLIILLILKSLGSLNFVSTILTLVAVFLLFSYFKKRSKLTIHSNVPKMRNLGRRKRR